MQIEGFEKEQCPSESCCRTTEFVKRFETLCALLEVSNDLLRTKEKRGLTFVEV